MTDQAMSPLRRRMIEDMSIRKFTSGTQHNYVRFVKEFSIFFGRSPDKAAFVPTSDITGAAIVASTSIIRCRRRPVARVRLPRSRRGRRFSS